MKLRNVLVVHKMGYSAIEKQTVDAVMELLRKKKILHRSISRLEVNHEIVKGRDLIIIVGGDGTFLKTAQFTTGNIPFLCINADPQNTEGFFSGATKKTCAAKVESILKGKIKSKKFWRLIAKINGIEIEPCLNEYYIGQQKPYDVSRYLIQTGKKSEEQKSSGVLICTAAGSTAWCRGAGGNVLKPEKKVFQFVVREPYVGTLLKTKITKGILKEKEMIKITAKTDGMIIVPDAVGKEHLFQRNAVVEISLAKSPILLFK
ncbi:NAD(+)/NADH kinase [Candidatus Woesearchaeota archaeon]|nr:NAD(+)/NADH kinase [Candidatus Woesearchaeota archaeon]